MRVRVDIERRPAHETEQGDAGVLREFYGETRRRRHGADDGNAGQKRFLNDLVRRPAADEKHRVGERQPSVEQHAADHLVDRVMPADVLRQYFERAGSIEQAGAVQRV